ncbi:MAG: hypothetical protein ABIW76_13945 [Fibrobacteria bacterium]
MENATQAWADAEHLTEKAKDAAEKGGKEIRRITETAASRTPTLLFVGAALGAIGVSLLLQILGKKQWSLFVAHWVPSLMMFGLYNKLSKTVGVS